MAFYSHTSNRIEELINPINGKVLSLLDVPNPALNEIFNIFLHPSTLQSFDTSHFKKLIVKRRPISSFVYLSEFQK